MAKNPGQRYVDETEEDNDQEPGDNEKYWVGLRTISEKVLQVLLEKRTTTYKQVSDLITNDEAQKLSFLEAGDNEQSKAVGEQKETNRKRIKNLRRRVYDSLNVLLACGLFRKEKKKVVFNEEFYECMPDHFKALYDEENGGDGTRKNALSLRKATQSDVISSNCATPEKMARLQKLISTDSKTVSECDNIDNGENKLSDPEKAKKLAAETKEATKEYSAIENRVKAKVAAMQQVVGQIVQSKRLIKRNMRIEKEIRKQFLSQNQDVSFENQRLAVPFILLKMQEIHNDPAPLEHDGCSKIRLKSSIPIECLGDAQILNSIYPVDLATEDSENAISKIRQYMPFNEYQKYQRLLKRTRRRITDLDVHGVPEDIQTGNFDESNTAKKDIKGETDEVSRTLNAILDDQ